MGQVTAGGPTIGYAAMLEQFAPMEVVGLSAYAEEHGFSGVMAADHFQPWVPAQGQAAFVWNVLTAIGERTVGDMGALPSELPWFALPQVPFTLETLKIILPYALTLTMVGLLESLMTAAIVDEMTDTTSDKNRECAGQGLSNITAGLFGGMAGCAMIGQSVINVSSGGRGRLSTLWAGAFLLFLIAGFFYAAAT